MDSKLSKNRILGSATEFAGAIMGAVIASALSRVDLPLERNLFPPSVLLAGVIGIVCVVLLWRTRKWRATISQKHSSSHLVMFSVVQGMGLGFAVVALSAAMMTAIAFF